MTSELVNNSVEFAPEEDIFEKHRKKSVRHWILAHLFHKSNKIIIIIVLFTTIISSILNSALNIVIGGTINDITENGGANLYSFIIIIIALGIGAPLTRLGNFMLREILAQKMERDTRREFFINLLGKSQSFHDRQKIGDLMARATDDVRMLNFLISPAVSLIIESFSQIIIPIIFIALFYPVQLLLAPVLFSILFYFTLKSYIRKLSPVTTALRRNFGKINAILNETLSGIEVVKSSTQEISEYNKYYNAAKEYTKYYIKQGEIQAKYIPILIISIIISLALTHAIFLYILGIMTIGDIVGYLGLIILLRFPTFISAFVFAIIRLAVSAADRLLETMNQQTKIDENIKGKRREIEGKITFKNVIFTYPDGNNPVLKNISLEIQPGQTIAIVGTTGSGKTTLSKLISRLYDVDNGEILIDDINLKEYDLNSLRNQISYIEQDIFLFSTSIKENISFGKLGTDKEIIEAARQAQAHEFISSLSDGYDSKVGERGVQLSGGERQRIAIARAFLADPKVLILDDSTSAIDSETEDKIQKAIKNVLKDRTTILITHRLSQIRWADKIIILKKGEIIQMGAHEELLATSEEYQKIFIKKFDVGVNDLLKGCE